MSRYAEQQRRTLIFVFLFFLFLTTAIGAVGYKSYRGYEAQSRADTERWLSVVANAKADEVSGWHKNLLDYADLIYGNQAFSSDVATYLQNPHDAEARSRVCDELQAYQRRDEIDRVDLLNPQGQNLLSIPTETSPLAPNVVQKIPEALQTKQITFVDFYRTSNSERVYLAVLVPVVNANLVVGLIILRVDPQVRLYPVLTKDVAYAPTTQTFLERRESNQVAVLSPLPFSPDPALGLQIPLEQTGTLEVKAALTQTGTIEATDHQGIAMIAVVRTAPEGWILITQTSVADMYDSIRVYFGRTIVVTGTVVFYSGLGLALIWRQQLLKRYQAESAASQQRAVELEAKVHERTAELSALSQQIADMHEKQIQDLAQELHDGVGQNLTAINLNLSVLRELLPENSPDGMKLRLADTSQLVEETVARMRNVMADFLPPMLEHYGLTPALTWYGEQFARRTNLQVNVHDRRANPGRLSTQAEVGLFRIVQEALNNAAKYANATKVDIEINEDREYMQMTISDNGVGFDPQTISTEMSHWGLAIMRERARALDATLEIQSAPKAGTKIVLRMARQT
ncbi:MAG: sensor histidine kinase [Chloroflexi bacterium]|nr:sensor histidine kinase [Chloroflexota bacterium]